MNVFFRGVFSPDLWEADPAGGRRSSGEDSQMNGILNPVLRTPYLCGGNPACLLRTFDRLGLFGSKTRNQSG